ncbi:MAG: hypothetical protein V1821_00655 [bacterium]
MNSKMYSEVIAKVLAFFKTIGLILAGGFFGMWSGALLGYILWKVLGLLISPENVNNNNPPFEATIWLGMAMGTIIGGVFGGVLSVKDKK